MSGALGRGSAALGLMISHGMSEQDVWQGHQALVPDAGGAVRRHAAGGAVGVRRADNALKARYCARNVCVCVRACARVFVNLLIHTHTHTHTHTQYTHTQYTHTHVHAYEQYADSRTQGASLELSIYMHA